MENEKTKREKIVKEIDKERMISRIPDKVFGLAGEAFKEDKISHAEYFQLILQYVMAIHQRFIEESLDDIKNIGVVVEGDAIKVRTE